jgi:hypothetical protein
MTRRWLLIGLVVICLFTTFFVVRAIVPQPLDQTWKLTSMRDEGQVIPFPSDFRGYIELRFSTVNQSHLYITHDFCNELGGQYSVSGEHITLAGGWTRRYCSPQEGDIGIFANHLDSIWSHNIEHLHITSTQLTLSDSAGKYSLTFVPAKCKQASSDLHPFDLCELA